MKKSRRILTAVLSATMLISPFLSSKNNAPQNPEIVEESSISNSLNLRPLAYTNGDNKTYTNEDITLKYNIPDVKAEDGTLCTDLQGMHVGTTYIYTAKVNNEQNRCVFIRVTTKTNTVETMNYYESTSATSPSLCTIAGSASEIVVRSFASAGQSQTYMYVWTGNGLIKLLISGNSLYYLETLTPVDTKGETVGFSSFRWVYEKSGFDYFLFKSGESFYFAKISQAENATSRIVCYKMFDALVKNALFATEGGSSATMSGIEGWTNKGFEYDATNKILYTVLFDHTTYTKNAIVTFNLDGIITEERLTTLQDTDARIFPTKLSFTACDDINVFEANSVGFRTGQGIAGDVNLYVNVDSAKEKEGIYSFGCNRHKENFQSIVTDSSVIYTVKYNGNTSTSGNTGDTVHINGIPSNLRWNYYGKEGYSFKGWYLCRESDGRWLCENSDGSLSWFTENKMPYGTHKALLSDMEYVDALTSKNGDTITAYAMWEKNENQNSLEGYCHIDLGTEFYASIKHTNTGLFATEENGYLAMKEEFNNNSSIFRFVKQNDGSYSIFSYFANNAWDVDEAIYIDERSVGMYPSNGTEAQKFFIYYINQNFYISPVASDTVLCLDKSERNICLSSTVSDGGKFEILKRSLDNYTFSTADFGESYTAFIRNNASGKLLTANGDSVLFTDATYSSNQLWKITKNKDGSHTIMSVSENKAVDVDSAALDAGTNIILYEKNETKAQSFYFLEASNGSVIIKPVYTSNIVDMDGSNFDVHLYPYGEGETQKFAQEFEIIPEKADGEDPVYMGTEFKGYISALSTGGIITDENNSVYCGIPVWSANQIFTFTYDTTLNAYTIIGASGNAITVENTGDSNGAKLVLAPIDDSVSQKFRIYAKDYYYYFSPVYTTKLVDLDTGDNKTLHLYDTDASERKRFSIVKTSHNGNAPKDFGSQFTAFIKDGESDIYIGFDGENTSVGEEKTEWTFTKLPDGSYTVKSENGLLWTLSDSNTAFGSSIVLSAQNGKKNQSFYIYEAENGYIIQCAINPGFITITDGVKAEAENTDKQVLDIVSTEEMHSALILKDGSSYVIKDGFLLNVALNTAAKDIVQSFANDRVCIFKAPSVPAEDRDICYTGYEICLMNDTQVLDSLFIVIKGDVDGNGQIDSTDYIRVKQFFLGNFTFDGAYFKAGDVDENGEIDSTDYIKIKAMFLNN